MPTFAKAEAACFAEKREVWRTDGAQHWRGPMDRYVLPKLDSCGARRLPTMRRPARLASRVRTRRSLALEQSRSVQDLMTEATNELFQKHGQGRIAD